MLIPFAIGLNSNAQVEKVDLATVPLLMVSYGEEKMIEGVFQQMCEQQYTDVDRFYLMGNSKIWSDFCNTRIHSEAFLRDEPEKGTIFNRINMFKRIITEIRLREKVLRAKKSKSFETYFSLNIWNEHKFSYQFLLIEDVWDIVRAKPASLGLALMRIIVYGPPMGIHCILGSAISYRNLLEQLLLANPNIMPMLQSRFGDPIPNRIAKMSAELLFNPDGMVFYKKYDTNELGCFYPMHQ